MLHSISPPLVVAANLTATTGGAVSTPASTPSSPVGPTASQPQRKRGRDCDAVLQFLKDQADREQEREREALVREEERERAAAARMDTFLSLFEKFVNKD